MCEALKREYQLCEEIGRGRFGIVYHCVSRDTGHSFAVKSIDKRLISNDSIDSQCLIYEPKILSLVSPHRHITQLFNQFEDNEFLHMILELCRPSHDLYNMIVTNGTLSESVAKTIMVQLMAAVDHIHRLNVVHRDIKPDNILFDNDNNVKLTDFGSAVFNIEGESTMSGVVGTPYYVAPEVLAGKEYGEKVDVWSCGVVLYVMLAGFPPFNGETSVEVFEAVMRGNLRFPTRVFQNVSMEVKDLIRRMLCKDVARRFSTEQGING
ncbi:hypothetical protein ACFE04_013129 [Oxalis oulophora]